MSTETKTCASCKASFTIEPDDFAFYEKLKVPPPTFCPECRTRRRFMWRNERSLHKRKCDAPGHTEELISMYSPGVGRVYDYQYWWSDAWDPMGYGRDYNFSKPFFEQFAALRNEVPLPNLSVVNSVNSDYSNWTEFNKNCYLVFAAGLNENVRYAKRRLKTKRSPGATAGSTQKQSTTKSPNNTSTFPTISKMWMSQSCRMSSAAPTIKRATNSVRRRSK